MANKLYVNNSNGRKARATKTVFDDATGRQIFTWLSGMVKDGLATTNPDLGTGNFDNLLGIQSGSHAMAFDTSAALGTISAVLSGGARAERRARRGAVPGAGQEGDGGALVSGGALYMVNKSAPAKQAAAWKFLRFLDDPENMTTWAIGTGYLPILEGVGRQSGDAGLLGAEPRVQGRVRPAARRARRTRRRRVR